MARYYVEEPCEHGFTEKHEMGFRRVRGILRDDWVDPGEFCEAGSRRELEDVEIVDWCETHRQLALNDVGCAHGGYCSIVQTAIIPLSGDTE